MNQVSSPTGLPVLFQRIVDEVLNGLIAFQPIRDAAGVMHYQPFYHNDRAGQLLGLSEAELNQKALFGRFLPDKTTAQGAHQLAQPLSQDLFIEQTGQWVESQLRRLEDGFFVVLRNITDRKRHEAEILQQHALLDGVLNTFLSGITIYDPVIDATGQLLDFRFVFVNEGSLQLTRDVTRDQVIGRTITDLYPNTRQEGMLHRYQEVYQTGQPVREEHYYPNLDKWIDVSIQKSGDRLLVTYNDITDRHRAESQVRQQAQLLAQISESTQMAVSAHQPVRNAQNQIVDFAYTYFNEKAREWLPVADWRHIIGQTVRGMAFARDPDQTIARMARVVDTGEPVGFDATTADGHVYYNIIARSGEGTVSTFIDVTQQRRNEQHILELKKAAEQQAAMLRSVLNGSQNAIIAFDAVRDDTGTITDFRYVLQNETNRQRVGRTDEQLLGHTMREFFPEVATNGLLDCYREVVETGQPFRRDNEYNYGKGMGWYNLSVVKRDDGIVLTVQDKTTEKTAELSLQETQQQLERTNLKLLRTNENLAQFASVASHDLQEPLRKVQAFSDLLMNQYADRLDTSGVDLLQRMQSATARMQALIRDLLTYSRTTIQPDDFELLPLQPIIDDVLNDLEIIITEKAADIRITALPTVRGNALQLRQLFQNLLANALKFTRPDARPLIQVGARRVPVQELPAGLAPVESTSVYDEITIQDNGIGFPQHQAERIFDAFQRLHGRNSPYTGSGVGLAIVKRVVENHGGLIAVQSHVNEGDTFRIYLPALTASV